MGVLGGPGADMGSLLGVSLGSWGESSPAATKTLKNRTPLERQGSLYFVICVFAVSNIAKQTRKSQFTASTDGGNLLGKTGLALERGAIVE